MFNRAVQDVGILDADDIEIVFGMLSPADVAPVVHGRWLPIVSYNNTYKCSECGRLLVNITDGLSMVAKHYPYCHCGAKMDGERKE
jgi:DNA-directed RNA polymerase subunit RPC12/RpoP